LNLPKKKQIQCIIESTQTFDPQEVEVCLFHQAEAQQMLAEYVLASQSVKGTVYVVGDVKV